MTFQVLPAIDIKNGKCIRLLQGAFDTETKYNNDPVSQAQLFEEQGAQYLHVVDLDGALEGNPRNFDLIRQIITSVSCKVEVSGGIRTKKDVERYREINPWQIILGSIAVFKPEFIQEVIETYGTDNISISLDSKDGFAASRGWVETSDTSITDLAQQLDKMGVQRYIFTDISRDGMMNGANIEETVRLKEMVSGQVIASGGVNSFEQVQTIQNQGLDGVVIGKALYEKKITLKEIVTIRNRSYALI